MNRPTEKYTVTRNACKLCNPLGACLAIRGVENAMPLLHGSQGCATYIRRYMISHFREPVDIASSNFSEDTAVFGGAVNLKKGIENVIRQYGPSVIVIASTCLSETIGDDVGMILKDFYDNNNLEAGYSIPAICHISTPSYRGTHIDGFHEAVVSLVRTFAKNDGTASATINLLPNMLSPADLRHLKEIVRDFQIDTTILPDYSETLDGPLWDEYKKISPGGTPHTRIAAMGSSSATIEFGSVLDGYKSAGNYLETSFGVKRYLTGVPVGIRETDRFMDLLAYLSGNEIPDKYTLSRGRLTDSLADAHKLLFGIKAAIYGEEDLVIALASFMSEIGIEPVICASGGNSGRFKEKIFHAVSGKGEPAITVLGNVDFATIGEAITDIKPDIMIGNSKGYSIARKKNIPLIRTGFPVHDRVGGQRILHIGYAGAQQLFDLITNTIISRKQESSPVGYTYM